MPCVSRYVVDVMTRNPIVVGIDTSAWAAECVAEERDVHHLIVIAHYDLIGEVCLCDLRAAKATDAVDSWMHSPPVTIDDQLTATDAARIMSRRGVGCLPVVDWAGALQGVVTRRDLRRAGILPARPAPACTSCGSTHGLGARPSDGEIVFCRFCREHTRAPQSSVDELYFTAGGGD